MSARISREVSIYGGGGWSFYACQPSFKEASYKGISGDFGAAFTGFFNEQIGLHIGAGIGLYNFKTKISAFPTIITPNLFDNVNGYHYDLHTTLYNYEEQQKTLCLSMPMMLQFQTKRTHQWNKDLYSKRSFYAMGGIKWNIVFKSTYESSIEKLTNAAYYPDLDNWAATQTFAGLGPFKINNSNGKDIEISLLPALAFETGMKWHIKKNYFLYTGVYVDYVLNDPTKDIRTQVSDYDYTAPKNLDMALLSFTDKIYPMTIGLKLRLARATFTQKTSQIGCQGL